MLTGIIRSVDDLGRIVIPSEWRRDLKLGQGDVVEVRRERDEIVIALLEDMDAAVGINKRFDALGRIVLPSEMRKELGITKDTPIEMLREGKRIVLKLKEEVCCICRVKPKNEDITLRLHNKIICGRCKKQIAKS